MPSHPYGNAYSDLIKEYEAIREQERVLDTSPLFAEVRKLRKDLKNWRAQLTPEEKQELDFCSLYAQSFEGSLAENFRIMLIYKLTGLLDQFASWGVNGHT